MKKLCGHDCQNSCNAWGNDNNIGTEERNMRGMQIKIHTMHGAMIVILALKKEI
jgi:hypothetical protein